MVSKTLLIRTGVLLLAALAGFGLASPAEGCIFGCFSPPEPPLLPLGDYIIPFTVVGALVARFGSRLFPVLPLRGRWAAYGLTLGFLLAAVGLWWAMWSTPRHAGFGPSDFIGFLGL